MTVKNNFFEPGQLTSTASSAFADTRPKTLLGNDLGATLPTVTADGVSIQGVTKDGHAIDIGVRVRALDSGSFPPETFNTMLNRLAGAEAAKACMNYNEADIAGNIGHIQQSISRGLEKTCPVGINPDGSFQYASLGINFGAPVVTSISDQQTSQVIYQRPAPATTPKLNNTATALA